MIIINNNIIIVVISLIIEKLYPEKNGIIGVNPEMILIQGATKLPDGFKIRRQKLSDKNILLVNTQGCSCTFMEIT